MLKKVLSFLFFIYHVHANISVYTATDGTRLRVGSWSSQIDSDAGKTIVLLTGRASFIEKNQEFIDDLTRRGFNVELMEWRGHGGSDRPILHSQKCHIDSFQTYLNDLHLYLENHVAPRHPGPWIMVGVSMGGHLALRYAHDHPEHIKKLALVVPMIDMATAPFPRSIVGPLTWWMCFWGFQETYAFGFKDIILTTIPPFSRETHDKNRHEKTYETMRMYPDFVISGPTFGWVKAAHESIVATGTPDFYNKITMPVFIQLADLDHLVVNGIVPSKCAAMKHCTMKTYKGSYHNITKETDDIRNSFLNDLELFLKNE